MSMQAGWTAGLATWKQGTTDPPSEVMQDRYVERWLTYKGELFLDAWRSNPWATDPRVYKNISFLWNHTTRVVNFFSSVVYQGELSSEAGAGAIPINPDSLLSPTQVDELMAAIDALNTRWNWQQQMLLIPKLTAALGDLMVELVDDSRKRWVFPRFVWPGYVTDVVLDYVGNVTGYTLEYMIELPKGQTWNGKQRYTFTKIVTAQDFRYFRDGQPYDEHGTGAVVPNPYGFVPAVWFRHKHDGMTVRGDAATDATRQMLHQHNSLFSHARDFQHKAFFAPFLVTGSITQAGQTEIHLMPTAAADTVTTGDGSAMAKRLSFLQATPGADIKQPVFDLGQTLSLLKEMRDGILATHPAAIVFEKMADAQNVTGPGAERILLPVKGEVTEARAGCDVGMAHLYQMAISMSGFRIAEGDWTTVDGPDGMATAVALDAKREVFRPFGPGAWEEGRIAFTIKDRPIVPPTQAERLAFAREAEQLQTEWAMEYSQLSQEDIAQLTAERDAAYETSLNRGETGGVYDVDTPEPLTDAVEREEQV